MKLEINWTPGPPSKPGKWLIAIIGSEDAIPAVFGQSGKIFSWTNSDVKYQPDHISFHAPWPQYPRERDQRWIECDRWTWEMMRGDVREVHKQIVAAGQDEYIAEKYLNGKPICRMEINMYGHLGARYFRWSIFNPQQPVSESADEYLDRLVKEAAPAWEGVDPDKFMDEVRGRTDGLQWKEGAPDMSGRYVLASTYNRLAMMHYDPDDEYWDWDTVFWHIGPIPPPPQNDAE